MKSHVRVFTGIGQAKFVGPTFPMMNDLGISILFNEGCHMLDRQSAGDVPVLSLFENAIQQSCGAYEVNVVAMQRSDGLAGGDIVVLPKCRSGVRNSSTTLTGRRNGIGYARA